MPLATQIAEFLGQYEAFGLVVLLVVAFIYVIKNFETMLRSWTLYRTSRISAIKRAIEASAENQALKKCYQMELEAEHFRLVSGIATTPEYRKSILDLLSKSEGKLTLSMIKRSQEFRDSDKDLISIKLTKKNQRYRDIAYWCGLLSFLIFILLSAFFIYQLFTIPITEFKNMGADLSNISMFAFLTWFFVRNLIAYNSALRVKEILDKDACGTECKNAEKLSTF
jgi:hypothetical protein